MITRNFRLRRDPSRGWIAGVCTGIADYLGISDVVVRIAWVALTLFGAAPVSIVAYILLALFLPVQPARLAGMDDDGVILDRSAALRDVDSKLRDAERRMARLEAAVLSEEFKLRRAFSRMRSDDGTR